MSEQNVSAEANASASALSGNSAEANAIKVQGNTFNVELPKGDGNRRPSVILRLVEGIKRARDPIAYERERGEAAMLALDYERRMLDDFRAMYPSMGEQRLFMLAHGYNMTDARAENVLDVMGRAGLGMTEPPRELPTAEFTDNFVESASSAYADDARERFAKLLRDELCGGGDYSPRAMSILADMDHDDAEAFRTLCSFIMDSMVEGGPPTLVMQVDEGGTTYNSGAFAYGHLSDLAALGLVNISASKVHHGGVAVFRTDGQAAIVKSPKGGNGTFKFGPILTRVGEELSRLCADRDVDAIRAVLDRRVAKGEISVQWARIAS